jgi:ribosome-dependent ATPase
MGDVAQRFGLGAWSSQLAGSLPLGVRQRLALAVAILHRPEVLVLDEPTSGVDPVARDGFWELLHELARGQGTTIFVSTHYLGEAERCDRIALLDGGRLLACDSAVELVRQAGTSTLEDAFVAFLEAGVPTREATAS